MIRGANHETRGYAALITTLFLCAVLTVLAFSSATRTYLFRLSVLEDERGLISRAHAYSCAQILLFELSADMRYRPHPEGDAVDLTEDTSCTIESIDKNGSILRSVVSGTHEGISTRLEILLEERSSMRPPFVLQSVMEI